MSAARKDGTDSGAGGALLTLQIVLIGSVLSRKVKDPQTDALRQAAEDWKSRPECESDPGTISARPNRPTNIDPKKPGSEFSQGFPDPTKKRSKPADNSTNASTDAAGSDTTNAPSGGVPANLAKQTLGQPPSSKVLGQNLEAVGVARPADTAAHHVVAGTDARAAQARAILKRECIDINEAANGVFLPKNTSVASPPMQTHSTVHTNRYYQEVNSRLQQAAPGTVRDVLADIAEQLRLGTFPH